MTDQLEPEGSVEPAAARPRIILEFDGPGLAGLTIKPEGPIQVAQVYGAAWLLEAWAREIRAQSVVGDMARQIMAPPPGLAGQLGLGRRS